MKSQIVYIYLHQYFKACKKRFEYATKKMFNQADEQSRKLIF